LIKKFQLKELAKLEQKKSNISELEFKLLVVDLSKMAFEQIIMESIGFQEIFERIKVNYKTAFLL
jgi:hypothetical protein